MCVGLNEFQIGDLAAYIPPDSLVSTKRPEFAFLKREGRDLERIKVKKLRGLYSQGLLIKAPLNAKEGDDVSELLEVSHYEPPAQGTACDAESGPLHVHVPTFDVESYRRYAHVLQQDEEVAISEKIHGANTKMTFHDGRFWVGSHRQWKKEGDNAFWRAFNNCQPIKDLLIARQDLVAYGEVYGWVQDLRYGMRPNEVKLAIFDLWSKVKTTFLNWSECEEVRTAFNVPWVPTIINGRLSQSDILGHAEGPSLITGANHAREGCVIRPVIERWNEEIDRVILKIVSNSYLERA